MGSSLNSQRSVLSLQQRVAFAETNIEIRAEAIDELGRRGSRAETTLPALVSVLEHDKDQYVRQTAAQALGLIQSRADLAVPALAKVLAQEKSSSARQTIMIALSQFGPAGAPAIPALRELLRTGTDRGKAAAATTLGRMSGQARVVVSDLLEALHDSNTELRRQAVWALGEIGIESEEVVAALIEALKDPAPEIRERALEALAKLVGAASDPVPAIKELIRRAAITALGNLGPKAAAAIDALRKIGVATPDVRNALNKVMREGRLEWRISAAWALAELTSAPEVPVEVLTSALSETDAYAQQRAATALAALGEKAHPAIPALRLCRSGPSVVHQPAFGTKLSVVELRYLCFLL